MATPHLRPVSSPTFSWRKSPETPTERTHEPLSLGVCCMASKASSAPMQSILRRLEMCGDFQVCVFEEDAILHKDIEEWPIVDCLIAFESKGFPLEKCIDYCKLRNPHCINNVEAQAKFRSRAMVYKTLTEWCIPCPDHVIVDHAAVKPNGRDELEEHDNHIVFNGKKISKPFVEKPEDGNRHDIWIYYPRSIGGGTKKLFRKVKDQSSEFDPNQNQIRRDGVYIYEPFLPTQGTDIKVYTVGAGYVHAEARKAPTVDGKVQRSKDGKEVRYPVVLTQGEKAISAFIVKAFRQNICGFDILRTDGGSYVCDVNGWSFVKGNQKYYNDCSTLMRKHLLDACGVFGGNTSTMILGPGDEVVRETGDELSGNDYATREGDHASKGSERLRSVIVVMRHGDRRPKEKLKFKCKQPAVLSYFDTVDEGVTEVKLKTTEELETLKARTVQTITALRDELQTAAMPALDADSKKHEERLAALKQDLLNMELLVPVLGMEDRFSGLERKVQLKAVKWKQNDSAKKKAAQVQVVAKWGGELTISGLAQAEELGRRLRADLYPNDPTGLLRLHSSFRHDFKIYSSQEGRCQITAAAFTKGFLELEGDIIPILVSLVTRDSYAQRLLDEPIPKKVRDSVKRSIESFLMSYDDLGSNAVIDRSCPTAHSGLREAAKKIGSPLQLLHTIKYLAWEYIESISAAKERTFEEMKGHHGVSAQDLQQDDATDDAVPLGDIGRQGVPDPMIPFDMKDSFKRKWLHLRRKEHRWRKLFNGFVKMKDDEKGFHDDTNVTFDPSKIPDVWDNLYYDMLTHRHYLGEDSCRLAEMMVGLIHPLNEWVCLSEYGISEEEKLRIGVDVTWRLIGKMLGDLEFMITADAGVDEAGRFAGGSSGLPRGSLIPRSLSGIGSSGVPRLLSASSIQQSIARRPSGIPGAAQTNDSVLEKSPPKLASDAQSPLPSSQGEEKTEGPSKVLKEHQFEPPTRSVQKDKLEEVPDVQSEAIKAAITSASLHKPSAVASNNKREWQEWATNSSAASEPPPLMTDVVNALQNDEDLPATSPRDNSTSSDKGKNVLKKLSGQVRTELTRALRDSSDWHPRLNEEVGKITDINNTKIVRSRIYVTSASTMHSLFNILRHGHCASGDGSRIVSDLGHVIDLNYLTHIVFRCYERDLPDSETAGSVDEKSRYRVEVSMSPGVQAYKGQEQMRWPRGSELREENCRVSDLQIIGDNVQLADVEKFLTDVVKEYGGTNDTETPDEKGSDND